MNLRVRIVHVLSAIFAVTSRSERAGRGWQWGVFTRILCRFQLTLCHLTCWLQANRDSAHAAFIDAVSCLLQEFGLHPPRIEQVAQKPKRADGAI
jgi:hypothetical protein